MFTRSFFKKKIINSQHDHDLNFDFSVVVAPEKKMQMGFHPLGTQQHNLSSLASEY